MNEAVRKIKYAVALKQTVYYRIDGKRVPYRPTEIRYRYVRDEWCYLVELEDMRTEKNRSVVIVPLEQVEFE